MLVDASPLVYLAKMDALDVFEASGHVPLITTEVEREAARPGLAYEHPDSVVIIEALRSGALKRTNLSEHELEDAQRLRQSGGIGAGESEALAAAAARKAPVLVYDRRAARLAGSMSIRVWTPPDILIAGTRDRQLLLTRIKRFAALVQMRFEDVQALIERIEAATDDR